MSSFDPPAYLKDATQSDDVIIFGKGPAQESEDAAEGVARFGGLWRSPSYLHSYVRAAKLLIERARESRELDDIGLPAFYLQRHATELLVKRVLSWLHEIHGYKTKAGESGLVPTTAKQKGRLTGSHALSLLWRDALQLTSQMGFEAPPAQLTELIEVLESFEKSSGTCSRCERDSRGDAVTLHVEHEVVVPLVEMQARLEAVVRQIVYRPGHDGAYEEQMYDVWLEYARDAGDAG